MRLCITTVILKAFTDNMYILQTTLTGTLIEKPVIELTVDLRHDCFRVSHGSDALSVTQGFHSVTGSLFNTTDHKEHVVDLEVGARATREIHRR